MYVTTQGAITTMLQYYFTVDDNVVFDADD